MHKDETDLRIGQYEKDCVELEKLNSASRKSTQDFYKIQYLNLKIREYEEQIKKLNLLTELGDLIVKNYMRTFTQTEKDYISDLKKY